MAKRRKVDVSIFPLSHPSIKSSGCLPSTLSRKPTKWILLRLCLSSMSPSLSVWAASHTTWLAAHTDEHRDTPHPSGHWICSASAALSFIFCMSCFMKDVCILMPSMCSVRVDWQRCIAAMICLSEGSCSFCSSLLPPAVYLKNVPFIENALLGKGLTFSKTSFSAAKDWVTVCSSFSFAPRASRLPSWEPQENFSQPFSQGFPCRRADFFFFFNHGHDPSGEGAAKAFLYAHLIDPLLPRIASPGPELSFAAACSLEASSTLQNKVFILLMGKKATPWYIV